MFFFNDTTHTPKTAQEVFSWSLDYCPCTFIDYFIKTHVVGNINCVIGHKLVNSQKMKIELLESLQKHAYSNVLKILPPKIENFHFKKIRYFFIFLLKT